MDAMNAMAFNHIVLKRKKYVLNVQCSSIDHLAMNQKLVQVRCWSSYLHDSLLRIYLKLNSLEIDKMLMLNFSSVWS